MGGAYLGELFIEALDESADDFPSVVDLFRVLAHDPDERAARVGLVELVDALAECGDDAFITWVFPENVLDDWDRFLNHIVNLCRDQVQEYVHALFRRGLDLDGYLAYCFYCPPHKVHVNLHGILFELREQLVDIALVGYSHHNFDFLEFQVGGVVVFAEKYTDFFAEDFRLALKKEINVAKGDVLNLGG